MTTPQMDPELQRLLAEVRSVTADAVQQMAAVQADLLVEYQQQRAERQAVQEQQAERARAGEFGDDVRRLQQRIDNGRTDLQAVVDGTDDSPEAAELRTNLERNAAESAAAINDQIQEGLVSGTPDPRDEVRSTVAELQALVAQLTGQQQRNDRGQ